MLLALRSRGGDVSLTAGDAYTVVDQSALSARFARDTAEGVRVERGYDFKEGHFDLVHTITLTNQSNQPKRAIFDLVLTGKKADKEPSFFSPGIEVFQAVCRTHLDDEMLAPEDLEERPARLQGAVEYAGIGWQYFLAAAIPAEADASEGCSATRYLLPLSDADKKAGKDPTPGLEVALHQTPVDLKPGESKTLTYEVYLGPKQLGLLQEQGHQLDENIDFGIFGIISRPMLWLLVTLNGFAGNFGIAIILLTLLIKLLTFPLTQKSYVSMQQMKTVAPAMKELQQKYGHDRQLLGQKQMEMYQEKGINPLAGCLPMLVQMPIWFALYRTLWSSVELYQQPFYGWITDLSQPESFPGIGIPVLPFFVGALMLFQTSLQPPPNDQPQMKYVLWAMPIMFTFFMFSMPSGLAIYMITNSSLTMVQQLFIKKKYGTPDEDAAKPASASATKSEPAQSSGKSAGKSNAKNKKGGGKK